MQWLHRPPLALILRHQRRLTATLSIGAEVQRRPEAGVYAGCKRALKIIIQCAMGWLHRPRDLARAGEWDEVPDRRATRRGVDMWLLNRDNA